MYETLKSETWRPMFHLLNNGLSITCDSYILQGNTLHIKNFQIVNGCQTTVTLHKAKNLLDDKVLIDIKVTECNPTIATKIAGTTNTQAGLKAQDFISTDLRQTELQRQFEALPEPWFYEIRRGEWARMVDHRDKIKFRRQDATYRVVKIKDVAQAALAYAGMPGEAKDHTKTIFQHKLSSEDTQAHYEDIFSPSVTAKQLFLYWLIYSNVKSSVEEENTASDFPGYGRLHSVWLIGEMIRQKYAISTGPVTPDSLATLLAETIHDWFRPLYVMAKQALGMAVDVERTAKGDTYSHREFFRGTKSIMHEKLPSVIEYAKTFSQDPLDKLPGWKQSPQAV